MQEFGLVYHPILAIPFTALRFANLTKARYALVMELTNLLPDGISAIGALAVIGIAMIAAGLTAAFGLGGGLILLAAMSALLPPLAVIPVHGVAQLGSNAGRTLLQLRHVVWPVLLWFTLGGVLGTILGGQIIIGLPPALLKLGVGAFVLLSMWGPSIKIPKPGARSFFVTGAIGGFLTLFFGATGPIAATVLRRTEWERFAITATHGACMLGQHLLKVVTFGALGFAYHDWIWLIALILSAGFVGTLLGTRLLVKLPEKTFRSGFKTVLTVVGLYLILSAGFALINPPS